ncbi:hypothetical protein MKW94_010543 [Papaver nudicaule]|uniref:TFIIS N-terminal domain-containing protein n=1 Tax=Papaver nudicaule TaxID=74823 RepID=A0AA41V3K6_PAPNU|nr:hypothetical protein [Papaver nudicaule]
MTLEDFFTLTEMKDGLMALARVEELVSVIKEEKATVTTNIGETARQWCTVASTLAATEDKDILDHFIRLEGLDFLDRWLQEARQCLSVTSDSSVEESIVSLLGALEKLPIDGEKSVSSGIGKTVKNLFDVKNFTVQEKARTLFDSWSQRSSKTVTDDQVPEKTSGSSFNGVEPICTIGTVDSGSLGDSVADKLHLDGSANLDNPVNQSAGGEKGSSGCSDSSQSENVKDVKIAGLNYQDNRQTSLSSVGKEDGAEKHRRSFSSETKPHQEGLSNVEERTSSVGVRHLPASVESNVEGRSSDVTELKPISGDEKETVASKGSQDTRGKKELSSSSSLGRITLQNGATQSVTRTNLGIKESEFGLKKSRSCDLVSDTPASELNNEMSIGGGLKPSRIIVEHGAADPTGGRYSNVLLNRTRTVLRKPEDVESSSSSRKEDMGALSSVKEAAGESVLKAGGGKASGSAAYVSKSKKDTKALDAIDKKKSDAELDYGGEDALEVARQVAKEVEQLVVDYREEFCSTSSEKNSGGVADPGSPDSVNVEQEHPATGAEDEDHSGEDIPPETISPDRKNTQTISEITDKNKDCVPCQDSSQVTETTEEPVVNAEKSMCDFDLNDDVCMEEMDHPVTPTSAPTGSVASGSAPITVVSASKAAVPRLTMAPLHFEGELGWKGSAATSAFRPAFLRRTPEAEKSISGSSHSSKQRQDFRDIDLNVAEGDVGGVTDPVLAKPIPATSDLHSGESSVEVSSRRAERLKLDLNRTDDNEEMPSDWKVEGGFAYQQRNGHYSPSPASSSSSRPSSSMRNFDLNDNPSFFEHTNDQRSDMGKSLDRNGFGGSKLDDHVISILGTRVELNKKEFLPQTRSFLPNGQTSEFPSSSDFARAGGGGGMRSTMTYTPSPVFGYNGFTAAGPSMPLSQGMYGSSSAHYMVDSRGTPVIPQVMSSSVAPPNYSRPQFLMNSSTGHVSGMNGAMTMQPGVDLNLGMTVVDVADNRDPHGGFRQLFIPGQGGVLMEEQMRSSSSQAMGSGMKRKEPDGGWDLYPVGYKQKSPWQ